MGGSEKSLRNFVMIIQEIAKVDLRILMKMRTFWDLPKVNKVHFIDYRWNDSVNSMLIPFTNFRHTPRLRTYLHRFLKVFSSLVFSEKYRVDEQYDIAVAYNSGLVAEYVVKEIKAHRKICFYHQGYVEKFDLNVMKQFQLIVCVSHNVKRMLHEAYPVLKSRLIVIENYVEIDNIPMRNRETKKITQPSSLFEILSVGRLSHEKGFDMAVEAMRILVYEKNFKGLKWLIIGEGTERLKIEKMIRKCRLDPYITLVGEKSDPFPYYANCDLYVQPSRIESYGLSIIEALVCQCPVIATKTLGATEILGDGNFGLLCDINAVDLANSITRILEGKLKFESYPLEKIETQNENTMQEWSNMLSDN